MEKSKQGLNVFSAAQMFDVPSVGRSDVFGGTRFGDFCGVFPGVPLFVGEAWALLHRDRGIEGDMLRRIMRDGS